MVSRTVSNLRRANSVGRAEDYYPSPFFDVASTYIPSDIYELFKWCSYYQLTNPVIGAVTSRLASYPITELDVRSDNLQLVDRYETIARDLKLRLHLMETNLDRYTFGNSYSTVLFPIRKLLTCRSCKKTYSVDKVKRLWRDCQFYIHCSKCKHEGIPIVEDVPIRSYEGIRLIRWNPMNVRPRTTGLSEDDKEYHIKLTRSLKNRIRLGDEKLVTRIPQAFIDAVRKKQNVLLDDSMVYHSKRPSSSREGGEMLGMPIILPVLKEAFFLQVLRKSQEAVAMEHIVPMRVLFPQIRGEADNVYSTINLEKWQKEVTKQVLQWKRDINHIPVMSVPIGYQQVGGQGRALMLHQDIRIVLETIISGMGVPVSFYFGEAQYSGASVNLKALENEFSSNRDDMQDLIRFIFNQISRHMKLPPADLGMKPFKMADDLQRASYDMQLNQLGKLSEQTLLERHGHNYEQEQKRMSEEAKLASERMIAQQKVQAEAQGQATVISVKYQLEAQQLQQSLAPQPPQQGPEGAQPQQPPEEGQPQEAPPEQAQAAEEPPPEEPQAQEPEAAQALQEEGMTSPVTEGGTGYVDLFAQARGIAQELAQEPSEARRLQYLTVIERQSPQLYSLVTRALRAQTVMPSSTGTGNPLPTSTRPQQ